MFNGQQKGQYYKSMVNKGKQWHKIRWKGKLEADYIEFSKVVKTEFYLR